MVALAGVAVLPDPNRVLHRRHRANDAPDARMPRAARQEVGVLSDQPILARSGVRLHVRATLDASLFGGPALLGIRALDGAPRRPVRAAGCDRIGACPHRALTDMVGSIIVPQ